LESDGLGLNGPSCSLQVPAMSKKVSSSKNRSEGRIQGSKSTPVVKGPRIGRANAARKPSALVQAIEVGLASGDLRAALRPLKDYKVSSLTDAVAICDLLRALESDRKTDSFRRLMSAVGLFRKVSNLGNPAGLFLTGEGLPLLVHCLDGLVGKGRNPEEDCGDLVFSILGILARYGTAEGTDRIVSVARGGWESDSYQWGNVLSNYGPGHPQLRRLFSAVSVEVPAGNFGRSLLWVANRSAGKEAGLRHPFDNPSGRRRILQWIRDPDPSDGEGQLEAVAAIAHLGRAGRAELLAAAEGSPIPTVRLEAAGTAAKLGLKSGLRRLVKLCDDWRTTAGAQQLLKELGRSDLIPPAARDPSFAALADMCDWIASPSELGRVPDSLEIVDHRSLVWPPGRRRKPFWVIRYRMGGSGGTGSGEGETVETGVGLVGSVTFCLFSHDLSCRPPEDVYGMHCAWELEQGGLLSERPAGAPGMMEDEGDDETEAWLPRWPGEPLKNAELVRVARFSPKLGFPSRAIGLLRAKLKGRKGHAIVDGERSVWVPLPSPFEGDVAKYEVLLFRVHVGRRLLKL
jgi:hypothetical protein